MEYDGKMIIINNNELIFLKSVGDHLGTLVGVPIAQQK